jgi:hypothetical protein
MVVQSAPQHSLKSPIIGLIWKTMQRNTEDLFDLLTKSNT